MQKNKIVSLAALSLAVFGLPSQAAAAPPGFALSLERGFGLSYYSESAEQGDVTQTSSLTNIGLGLGYATDSPSIARFALDYLLEGGLSLGAGLGYASLSQSSETDGGTVSAESEGPTTSAFVVAPRVGYVLPLSETIDFWPRGGISIGSLAPKAPWRC